MTSNLRETCTPICPSTVRAAPVTEQPQTKRGLKRAKEMLGSPMSARRLEPREVNGELRVEGLQVSATAIKSAKAMIVEKRRSVADMAGFDQRVSECKVTFDVDGDLVTYPDDSAEPSLLHYDPNDFCVIYTCLRFAEFIADLAHAAEQQGADWQLCGQIDFTTGICWQNYHTGFTAVPVGRYKSRHWRQHLVPITLITGLTENDDMRVRAVQFAVSCLHLTFRRKGVKPRHPMFKQVHADLAETGFCNSSFKSG